jgi:hypothetical protein
VPISIPESLVVALPLILSPSSRTFVELTPCQLGTQETYCIVIAGLLERDSFDLLLPEFDKPWVIHLRETCCCSTNLCTWRPNTVCKNKSVRRDHLPVLIRSEFCENKLWSSVLTRFQFLLAVSVLLSLLAAYFRLVLADIHLFSVACFSVVQ